MSHRLLNFITIPIGTNYALLSPEWGSCFVCDANLYDQIIAGSFDDDLALKLHQSHILLMDGFTEMQAPSSHSEIKPVFFLIDVSQVCNLACLYCFRESKGTLIEKQILDETLDFIYSYCRMNNVQRISIQPWGGEPLFAMERIRAIFHYFKDKAEVECKISIESNGTLITPKIARELREMKCGIGISLDGIAHSHDQNRHFKNGKGSFSKVKHSIDCLLKAGYRMDEIGTVLTLTKHNLPIIEEIIDFYYETLNITKFKLNYAFCNANVKKIDKEVFLSPEEYAQSQIITSEKTFSMLLAGKAISESNIVQKGRNILFRNKGDVCKSQGCQGGYRMIAFDSIGNIYPCNLIDFPDVAIGNIHNNSDLLTTISNSIKRNHRYFRPKRSDKCVSCGWNYFCRGGCRTTTFYAKGEFELLDEYECCSNQVLYPYLIRRFLDQPELIRYFEKDIN